MACLLIPMTMVVIGHHINDVQVEGQLGNVICLVNDLLARGHSG